MTKPFVTVLIPAYNAAETIQRAVDSALAQTYRNYEVVVVDDGSRDTTADIVTTLYGDRVRLLCLTSNQGESAAMNEGIAAAEGELIAFLDADDEWLPDKLARQVEALALNPNAVLAASGCRFACGHMMRDDGIFSLTIAPSEIWRLLLARTMIAKPCVVARSAALRAVGPFDTSLAVGADQDMWIRLAVTGEVVFVPEILTIVHDTAGSLTKTYADTSDRYVLPMVRRHVEQQRHRLADREVRAILSERYAAVGRNLYSAGSLGRGSVLVLHAMLRGHRVIENLWYLITASPPMKATKRLTGWADNKNGKDGSRKSIA